MGYDKPEAIRRLLRAHDAATQADDEATVARIHAGFVARMIDCYRHDPRVAPMPGAEETFAQLRQRGLRIALNAAFSRDIADAIVARLRWRERGLIDDLIAADEVPAGRPQPYMIDTLRARAGDVAAAAVVKIDDTEVDIAEGRNAGVGKVVSVTRSRHPRHGRAERRRRSDGRRLAYAHTHEPFDEQQINAEILGYLSRFARFKDPRIAQTWHGIYPKLTDGSSEFVAEAAPDVTVLNCFGGGGLGMTQALGLAEEVVSGQYRRALAA